MGKVRDIDPSPIRSGLAHAGLSLLVFGGFSAAIGAGIHLTGDPLAAGPQAHLALFDTGDTQPPALKARLQTSRDLAANGEHTSSQHVATLDEPSLGVDYVENGTRIASLAISPPSGQGDAVSETPPGAIRINGKLVKPGESLSSLSGTEIISLPKVDSSSLTEYRNGLRVPRIASDGRSPADVYARPFANPRGQPVVSLIVGGLGINARHTKSAIEELPPEVTLSFAPDGRNLQMWINRAREAGHEVMLELPMQPFEYGRMRPHPYTLSTQNDAGSNVTRLEKLLSRATGYFGVINYQGAKLATSENASDPILEALAKRGLVFVEDGSLQRSVFGKIAADHNLRYTRAAHPVDLKRDIDGISNQLAELESLARENGAAMGTAYAYPVTIDTAKAWTGLLAEKGILLAPASAMATSSPVGSFRTGSTAQGDVNTAG